MIAKPRKKLFRTKSAKLPQIDEKVKNSLKQNQSPEENQQTLPKSIMQDGTILPTLTRTKRPKK